MQFNEMDKQSYQNELSNQKSTGEHTESNAHGQHINNQIQQVLLKYGKKLPLTFIYCLTFWNFGICVAIFGPTLLDLACQTSSTLSAMSFLYFMQNFTALIGCFVSGILIKQKKIGINELLLICTILMPICVSLMPFAKHASFLGLVMTILGFNMGCIDNVANLAILKLHSNNVSPYIQTMHFFYGVGAFFTPIVIKSFLNSDFDIAITSSSFNCYNVQDLQEFVNKKPYLPSLGIKNQTELNYKEILPEILSTRTHFTSQTKYAFWILALIQLPAPIILFAAKLRSNSDSSSTYDNIDPASSGEDDSSIGFSFSLKYFKSLFQNISILQMTLLMSLLVFLFEGLQASHGGYIFSYTVEEYDLKPSKHTAIHNHTLSKQIMNRHHHSQNDDAYITALFWAFFSIGRLASIYIATKFSSSFMISIDIIGCILSSALLILSSVFGAISLLYIATCLLGLFLSNTTPTVYSLAEIHIGVTPTLTSFIIVCAASGEMIVPLIVANLFESVGPSSLLTVEFILSLVAGITFIRFVFYAKHNGKSFDARDSFIWLSTLKESDQSETKQTNLVGKTANKYYSKMEEESD